MSEQGTIFGCIYGSGPVLSPKSMQFFEHNRNTIQALPEKVHIAGNILIVRSLFSVPMPGDDGFYRLQMIHFGQSINHLDDYLDSWISQFEALLRKLYWFEAYAYMQAEIAFGHTKFHWESDVAPMFEDPPKPISSWKFTGGID